MVGEKHDHVEPVDILGHYPNLIDNAEILSDLLKLNPNLAKDIIQLAMVMAIYAEEAKQKRKESLINLHWSPTQLSPPNSLFVGFDKASEDR